MNKLLFAFSFAFLANLASAGEYDENFDTQKDRVADISMVVWKTVDNISDFCNRKNSEKGYKIFKSEVDSCAFWEVKDGKPIKCEIFTGKKVSMGTLGHELRHCFYGHFHTRQ